MVTYSLLFATEDMIDVALLLGIVALVLYIVTFFFGRPWRRP